MSINCYSWHYFRVTEVTWWCPSPPQIICGRFYQITRHQQERMVKHLSYHRTTLMDWLFKRLKTPTILLFTHIWGRGGGFRLFTMALIQSVPKLVQPEFERGTPILFFVPATLGQLLDINKDTLHTIFLTQVSFPATHNSIPGSVEK